MRLIDTLFRIDRRSSNWTTTRMERLHEWVKWHPWIEWLFWIAVTLLWCWLIFMPWPGAITF
jgi:hypothetical protein